VLNGNKERAMMFLIRPVN